MMKLEVGYKKFVVMFVLVCCGAPELFAAEQLPTIPTATASDVQQAQLQLQQLAQVAAPDQQPASSAGIQQPTQVAVTAPAQAPAPAQPNAANQQPSATQQVVSGASDQLLSEGAFSNMSHAILPMTPEQIQRLRQLFNSTQYAAAIPPTVPPKPVIRSQFVNLAPGTTPPPIRLKQGLVTSLAFLDSTGQPWPIEAYDIGDPSIFNVQWNKVDHILFVQPSKAYYDDRNLVVRLKGLATPVTLTLLPPQLSEHNAVDYRVDLHLSGFGPNAAPTPANGLPNGANPVLLGVLSGVPPEGSRVLTVTGGETQAWLLGDKIYVRSRLTILSPGWIGTMSSADGTKAYEMQKTPMILVSQNGRAVQLKIEGL